MDGLPCYGASRFRSVAPGRPTNALDSAAQRQRRAYEVAPFCGSQSTHSRVGHGPF